MVTKPTDDAILRALAHQGNNGKLTAYVADILRQTHGRDLPERWVLARLKYLEAQDKVHRVQTSYRRQICWAAST